MSRSEYRERQRVTDGCSSTRGSARFGEGSGDEESSTLGFSLGSVRSAPAFMGPGLGGDGDLDGRRGRACGWGGQGPRGGTAGRDASRCRSLAPFDNINPLEGGVRVRRGDAGPAHCRSAASGRGPGRDGGGERSTAGSSGASGALSPLSVPLGQDESPTAGPESFDVEEGDVDPHLSLLKVRCLRRNPVVNEPQVFAHRSPTLTYVRSRCFVRLHKF